jgi:uncharacterized protein
MQDPAAPLHAPHTASSTAAALPAPSSLRSHCWHGLAPGLRLLVLGAVHGNEVCGTHAMQALMDELDSGALSIERGRLTMVPVTNPLAYRLGQRMGERNLNRNMAPSAIPQNYEDRLANVLCPLLDAHDVLLDLHSFHTPGAPFVMIGPQNNQGPLEPFAWAQQEMQLALHTGPHRVLEGWLDTYARGTERRRQSAAGQGATPGGAANPNYGVGTTEYMRARGGYGVTLECGQHGDPEAIGVARRAIVHTLQLLGLTRPRPDVGADMPPREVLRLVDVTDREHPGDRLARNWRSFDPVAAGDVIGLRAGGAELRAPRAGFVVFPNPEAEVGQEWFYFAVERRAADSSL